ncbi:MAG: bifunctional homocysteine S-methyltransferase/methylenetetrahydrofolate reductase, partial [Desulfitobacteriaceae bacterium]|nr:bifunctional homocysteine S-methyltransferase/methylenetetrahydrofolate reductase [Desulfitobacteriaceae bacterium]
MLREYLQERVLVADGAMGTYYAQITGRDTTVSELANNLEPDIIARIHEEYIRAGAKLIRSNTFSVNTISLGLSRKEAGRLLSQGVRIAQKAAKGKDVFVAASIGPVPEITAGQKELGKEYLFEEYRFIVDTLLDTGAEIFVFETFSSTDHLRETAEYIKEKCPGAFIVNQFALMPDGFTRKGIGLRNIMETVTGIKAIDAFGFNCGTGPKHLFNNIKNINFSQSILSVLPNAGFPEIVNERTVFVNNPEYFADVMMEIKQVGAKIIGGCCGTTPLHIERIGEKLQEDSLPKKKSATFLFTQRPSENEQTKASFRLDKSRYLVAVELAPPCDCSMEKFLANARSLKETGLVDLITVPDSPLGKTRLNPIMAAAKVKREVGIEVMPHICCRDRNIIALKADLMGAYTEGIRNVLIITGDPIPCSERNETKSVFDLNSIRLMELINTMNREQFVADPINIAGGLNLNTERKDTQVMRAEKKAKAGAQFFLTQPVFEEEAIDYLVHEKNRHKIKILGGVMPIVSRRNAQFLNNEIPGIRIPKEYVNSFAPDMPKDKARDAGIEIALSIVKKIMNSIDGFYFITPFNRADMIVKILK